MKTLFDPCPAGWRVSRGGRGDLSPWSTFTMANGPWNGVEINPQGGRTWSSPETYGGRAWYAATGYRWYTTGLCQAVGNSAFIWYSSTNGTEGNDSGFYWQNSFYAAADDQRTYGFSVRCVRE